VKPLAAITNLDTLALDLRRVLRRLTRAPGFAATVIISLAIGMASVIALLGVIDTLFFREPAGLRDARRVVAIGPWAGFARTSYPDYVDLRDQSRSLESVGAFAVWTYTARVGEAVAPARGLLASHSLLPTLGIAPFAGRTFVGVEDRPGAAPVALISAGLRHRFFSTDRDALGQSIRLAGIDFTIIGILPPSFTAPDMSPVDLVLPIENAPWFGGREALVNRDFQWVRIVGRLKPGVPAAGASADASAIYRRANVGVRAVDQTTLAREVIPVRPLREARRDPSAPSARVSLWLMGLAAVVLLIACANVASLFAARGIADEHEFAVHVALGASSRRLATRALLEVGVLVTAAALLAIAIANVAAMSLGALLANSVVPAPMDMRTGAIAVAIAGITCVVCALGPIVRATRTSPRAALGIQSRTATSSHRRSLRALVSLQMALGVVLVSEAAVFAASLRNATRADLGFDLERLAVADVDLRAAGFTPATSAAAATRALDAVRRIPGVAGAGMTNAATVPGYLNPPVRVPGRDSTPAGIDETEPYVNSVTAGFLDALGVPLLRGRRLTDQDVATARPVALASARFAGLYWRGEDALGQCVRIGRTPDLPCAQVVGIVGDRRASPAATHGVAEVYLPAASTAMPAELAKAFMGREIAVRVEDGHPDISSALQQALLDELPALTSVRVRVGDAYLEWQTRSWRLGAAVIGVFAVIALALAAVGVFSVWSHAVAIRRRELGIRGALGARPGDLAWLIVRDALAVAAIGVAVGVAVAIAVGGTVKAMAFGISPIDPRVFAVSCAAFVLVTCVATLVPALRAAFTDPRSVLAT
jgi:predicted permease